MLLMEERDTFAALVAEAIRRAGGLRPLARVVLEGGENIQPSHLGDLRDGLAKNDLRVPNGIAHCWPDLAARMYEALGVLIPEPEPDLVEGFRQIAAERGIPVSEVASALVNEELKRIGKK